MDRVALDIAEDDYYAKIRTIKERIAAGETCCRSILRIAYLSNCRCRRQLPLKASQSSNPYPPCFPEHGGLITFFRSLP